MRPYYDHGGITIYHGDCREVLPTLDVAEYALVTDPPYGIEADKRGAHSSIRDNELWPDQGWDNERQPVAVKTALSLCATAAVWGGNFYADVLPVSSGWLAWIKPEAESGFTLADMELCWTNQAMAARVKRYARRDGNAHPTQKPLAIMKWTMQFVGSGIVLDPFMGSGTTLVAAKHLGRRAIGIELDERYAEIAAQRLSQEVMALDV